MCLQFLHYRRLNYCSSIWYLLSKFGRKKLDTRERYVIFKVISLLALLLYKLITMDIPFLNDRNAVPN